MKHETQLVETTAPGASSDLALPYLGLELNLLLSFSWLLPVYAVRLWLCGHESPIKKTATVSYVLTVTCA